MRKRSRKKHIKKGRCPFCLTAHREWYTLNNPEEYKGFKIACYICKTPIFSVDNDNTIRYSNLKGIRDYD